MFNKKEIMKRAWEIKRECGWKIGTALAEAWYEAKNANKGLSDDLSLNSIYNLSWEEVKGYMASLKKRTRTFYSIAKAVYEKGKFSTHRSEFNALYHSVAK